MRHTLILKITLIVFLGWGLTGCIENKGATEEPSVGQPTGTPPDFHVDPPQEEQEEPTNPPVVTPNLDFLINNGATATKDSVLHLSMLAPIGTFAMKIGFAADCSDSEWIGFTETHDLVANKQNGAVTVSVQYRTDEGMTSGCLKRSIVHDNKGPEIVITKYPQSSIEEGATPEIGYTISDVSGLQNVTCALNDIAKACAGGTRTVTMSPLPEGSYTFTLSGEDKLGNANSVQVSWTVVSTTKKMTQRIGVNNYNKVDILINIDNSGSMEYEQRNMAQRMSRFLSILRGLDYQIAVTTTDPRDIALGDGRFIPIHGTNGEFILDTSTPEDTAQSRLGLTLQRPETGSGTEQGIYTSYRVIERNLSNSSAAHTRFIRDGAQLAVVVISDEDESANGTKNDPENLARLIHDSYGGQKTFTWHSVVTKSGDTNCKNTYGATYGARYEAFSRLTGGLIGSVCEADYATQVQDIALGIRNMLKTLTLECQALSQFPIVVSKDGQSYSGAFTVEGLNLKFATELTPGEYSVEYRCLR